MKIKNVLLAGLAGALADYLLGWLTYGMLFNDYFGGMQPDMTYITLGCLCFGMLFAFVLVNWANVTTFASGLKSGAMLGFLFSLTTDLFMRAHMADFTIEKLVADVALMTVTSAIVGGVIAAVNGALSKQAT